LHTRMDHVLSDGQMLTPAVIRTLAKQLADCTPTLNRLGPVSSRVQPAGDLAKRACPQYELMAKCFATAQDCGYDPFSTGSSLFADAEIKGEKIKEAAR
jgi:hypothetical protein